MTDRTSVQAAIAAAAAVVDQVNAQHAAAMAMFSDSDADADEDEGDHEEFTAKRTRRVRARPDYSESEWALMLRNKHDLLLDKDSMEAEEFRNGFRLPYPLFLEIVTLTRDGGWLAEREKDVAQRQCIPIELKVLAVLGVLGRALPYDTIRHCSRMSRPVVCQTLHTFCEKFAQTLYSTWVTLPVGEDLDRVMRVYDRLGFTGAMGSTDVTHVHWGRAPASHAKSYTGKEGYPTLAFEATVDFTRRVLGVGGGFPGAENDKTIVRLDATVHKVRKEEPYVSKKFELFTENGERRIVQGVYLIVDGGYHRWRILQCPLKACRNPDMVRWTTRLESVRKDVECFFGMLKQRFAILKGVVPFHKEEHVNNIFFTCCILHNMLLKWNGLDRLDDDLQWGGVEEAPAHGGLPASRAADVGPAWVPAEKIDEEDGHHELREQLVEHLAYRSASREHPLRWPRPRNDF